MDYYNEIKNELIDNELTKKAKDYSKNKSDLMHYYNVGKLLSVAGKHYGEGIIVKYSNKLVVDIDRKYNITNLKRIRQFYWIVEKGATVWHQLSWSHYKLLISLHLVEKINYYSEVSVKNNYSVRELLNRIKSNEYKIKIGKSYNYIDILLFNIEFNCYVVVELKIVELKKEHIGQIEIYMNYIDRNLKHDYHDKTIGIIICKHDNKLVLEYSSDPRIFSTTYVFS